MAKMTIYCVALVWIGCATPGCQSPFDPVAADELLQQSIDTAINRELNVLPAADMDQYRITTQPPALVEETLAERREELDAMSPGSGENAEYGLDLDLNGDVQGEVEIRLDEAIRSAVERNLLAQAAHLQPAISAQDVIAADAVFDALLFANADFTKTDQPTTVPVIGGIPIGTGFQKNEAYRYETGVRQLTRLGTEFTISTDLMRTQNNSSGISLTPDPAYVSAVRLGLTQPLLRGFGYDVNTSSIRLAENTERSDIEQYRATLLLLVAETERSYWELVFAWQDLVIREWLVDVGEEVRVVLERRREFDTKPAEYADAVATVERRKGEVIVARRTLRAASDALKVIINDPEETIGSEVLLRPVDEPIETPLEYSLRDSIITAIANRPEIQQAVLLISDAQIRQHLADNLRLPMLNLTAQVAYYGIEDDAGSSYQNIGDNEFTDYVLGINFEYPLGNRAAEAQFRRSRLERTRSLINYWNTVQLAVLDVKRSLRDVVADYELIQASRSFRVAQAENLRALLVEEETLAGLTPEFLNLKFDRQEGLAFARQAEIRSLVNFDQSLAEFYRAMGVGLEMKQIRFDLVDPMVDPDSLRPR